MGDALAPWHIIILVVVLVLLFGARRLPGAAKSLGESMHIFKRSVQGMNPEDQNTAANPTGQSQISATPLQSAAPIAAPNPTADQLADLQRQVADLQRQSAGSNGGQASEAQPTQPF